MSTPAQGKQDLGGEAAVRARGIIDALTERAHRGTDPWLTDASIRVLAEQNIALEARLAEAERRDAEKAIDLVNAGLHARDLRARLAEAERALTEIETTNVDWTKGVDENCERLKAIARAALPPESETR